MKNYTSSVDVETTIFRIEQILIKAGANNIFKEYDDQRQVSAVAFTLIIDKESMQRVTIRLPANVQAVYKALWAKCKSGTDSARQRTQQQAPRTAWKLTQDWLEVQLSMIEMQQAEALQVFLPYVWDGKQTLFSRFKESGFKGLPSPDQKRIGGTNAEAD